MKRIRKIVLEQEDLRIHVDEAIKKFFNLDINDFSDEAKDMYEKADKVVIEIGNTSRIIKDRNG